MNELTPQPPDTMDWNSPELEGLIDSEGLYIDCGANAGDAVAVLASGGGLVCAFEPNPHAFDALSERFASAPNVKLFRKAVADSDGARKLYLHESHAENPLFFSSGSSMMSDKVNVSGDFVEVECVRLSSFILKTVKESGRRLRILKIDIEGMEYEILEDLLNAGALRLAELTLVETHERKIPSISEKGRIVKGMIAASGYTNIKYNWT